MNKSMTIYLGGPIDDVSFDVANGWRSDVGKHASAGCLFFNPRTAFFGAGMGTAKEVDYLNRVILVHCDGLLVNLGGEGMAFGSIREIEFARMHNKPVAVATGETPIMSLTAHDLMLAETVDDALTQLMEAIRGEQDAPRGMMFQLPGFLTGGPEPEGDDG